MERTRTRAFDAVRITAVLCVVLTHTIQNELHLFPDAAFPAANAVWVLAMVCNPLYVMLSGALLAGPREESIPWFFWKIASRQAAESRWSATGIRHGSVRHKAFVQWTCMDDGQD